MLFYIVTYRIYLIIRKSNEYTERKSDFQKNTVLGGSPRPQDNFFLHTTTMKKYPKLVQTDKRGQIVIPKHVRQELGIDETTGFYIYTVPGEGILLKQIEPEPLEKSKLTKTLKDNAQTIGLDSNNLQEAEKTYKHTKGGLEKI